MSNSGVNTFSGMSAMSTAMKGQQCTNGWDIVCSYDLSKLNKMLQDQYSKANTKIVTTIPGVTDWTWATPFKGLMIDTYDFSLDAPDLSFESDGTATLNMAISKVEKAEIDYTIADEGAVSGTTYEAETWYSKSGDTYTPIADQSSPAVGDYAMHNSKWYSITAVTSKKPKSALSGSYSLIGNVPISAVSGSEASGYHVHTSGSIVVFKASKPDDQGHIALNFKNTASLPTNFSISPSISNNQTKEGNLLRKIRTYFTNVSEIDYLLNSVTPKAPTGDETSITPKSFVFSTINTGSGTGVLSTYIATTQNNGQGSANPSFDVSNQKYSPIPTGNTASMVFSKDFIQNVLIQGGLQSSLENCSVTFTSLTSGIQANVYTSSVDVDVVIPSTLTGSSYQPGAEPGWPGTYTYYYVKVDGDTLSATDHPLTLTLQDNTMSVAWNVNNAAFDYDTGMDVQVGVSNPGTQWSKDTNHNITIGITSNPSAPSTLSIDASDNITISPALAFDNSTYSASIAPPPAHEDCFEKFWSGNAAGKVHQALKGALATLAPSLSVKLPGLNYFYTTNLLFSGSTVFTVDTTAGVQVPSDLIILGNLDDSSN